MPLINIFHILPYSVILFNSKIKKYGDFMDFLSKFINYLQATKNLSDKTLKAYSSDLNQLDRKSVV